MEYSKSLNADDEELIPEASPFIVENGVLVKHVGRERNLIIPKEVHTIGKNAFKGHADVNQIVIPRTVKVIQDGAFDGFKYSGIRFAGDLSDWCEIEFGDTEVFGPNVEFHVLSEFIEEKMVIPSGVKRIRARAFKNLADVEEVVLPEGLESIEKEAFANSDVRFINLPKSLKKIGEAAFSWSGLEEIVVPGSVKEIGKEAFSECTDLGTAVFEEGVEKIGDHAFENSALNDLTLPKSLRRIGEYAFSSTGIEEVTIPEKVQTVERCAFSNNDYLATVHLAMGVKEVDERAFEYCSELSKVTFPSSLTYIGSGAFTGCSELKKVEFYGSNDLWKKVQKQPHWFDGKSIDVDLIEVKITPTQPAAAEQKKPTVSVDKWAAAAMGMEIRDNVLVAYYGSGETVRVPAGVLEIADDVFAGNGTIREVILPAGLTTIGANAFGECSNLTTVSFPKSLKEIGWGAFADCGALNTINYAGSEVEWFDVSRALFWDARCGGYRICFQK